MSGTTVPTLEETAVIKVAVYLHNDRQINQWSKFEPDEVNIAEWCSLIDRKVSKLFLPAVLRQRTFEVASRVCFFMVQMQAIHRQISSMLGRQCQCLDGTLENSFVRTSDDLFDEEKTVQVLIRDERIDAEFRFVLASLIQVDSVSGLLFGMMPKCIWDHALQIRLQNGFVWTTMHLENDVKVQFVPVDTE